MKTRRHFITSSAAASVGLALSKIATGQESARRAPFGMKFAPHVGAFKAHAGPDILDQIRFAHDQGFTAWEHNGMPKDEPAQQEKIGKLLAELGMEMGVFVAYGNFDRPTFAVRKKEYREEVPGRDGGCDHHR